MSDSTQKFPEDATWKNAFKVSLPVAMGYLPASMAFGILATVAGIPVWLSFFISICVFSGAAQYAAIPLIVSGASLVNLSLNTLAINLRHMFYALPILDALPQNKIKRIYCLFCLTDECFSLMVTLPKVLQARYFFKIAVLVHGYWLLGTFIGAVAGDVIGSRIPNLEFALTCLFVILWYEQLQQKKAIWPTLIACPAFLLTYFVAPSLVLIGALILSVLGILIRYFFSRSVS